MKKHLKYCILLFLPPVLFACGKNDPVDNFKTTRHRVDAYFSDSSLTRIGLRYTEGNTELIPYWQDGDMIQVFIVPTLLPAMEIGDVPARGISEDGKSCHFFYDDPDLFRALPNSYYSLVCLSGLKGGIVDGDIYCNGSMIRHPFMGFKVPIVSYNKSSYVMSIAAFKHYGTYELLHITNGTSKPIQFKLNGFVGTSWFKKKGAYRLRDEAYVDIGENPFADQPVETATIEIGASKTGTIISWYIPNGMKISNIQMSATIDGKDVMTTNKKSSDVEIKVGNAYNMYVIWDGTELKFREGSQKKEGASLNLDDVPNHEL